MASGDFATLCAGKLLRGSVETEFLGHCGFTILLFLAPWAVVVHKPMLRQGLAPDLLAHGHGAVPVTPARRGGAASGPERSAAS